ncbi:MAG TPA: bifunctional 1-(5-phosphoribosyl)-5-((5-phosphoribosylamino)methylideneamino)imidazole-4-carboxamide isomerase/phosphoribosylanthranilate isomerase PriA [Pseudonocardiaceae bacterium]
MSLTLLPAVDIVDGKAVRLFQGESGTEKDYGDPLDAALNWQRGGAQWIHMVDLDAAFGRGSNREQIAEVIARVEARVELSGGIRDNDSLKAALSTGCGRVNLGTAALENPEWCAEAISEYREKIAIGLDARLDPDKGWRLVSRGWTKDGGDLWEVLDRLDRDGCARYVVTDVSKDGTLKGPNIKLLREVCARTDAAIVASGGVSSLDDLRALAELEQDGVEGAIIGKALYVGAFTLPEALAAVR